MAFFLRIRLFLLNPDLHADEANLVLNFINTSYAGLFKPLERLQVAPPIFLVISKFIYNLTNLHPTAEFSDAVLRILPFTCGIISVPLFTKLLDNLFKNKVINLLGTLILAMDSYAVYYSNVFKQYSFEMFISILLLLLITSINFDDKHYKKNLIIFFLMGFAPIFSLSSYFILAGIFFYLFYLLFKNKNINYLKYISAIMLPLVLCSLIVILPIAYTHSSGMYEYWNDKLHLSLNKFLYELTKADYLVYNLKINYTFAAFYLIFASAISIMHKRIFYLLVIPFTITYLSVYFSMYPASGRLMLFVHPILIILTLLPLSKIQKKTTFLYIIFFLLFGNMKLHLPTIQTYILKPDKSRTSLNYLMLKNDNKSPVIISGSKNSYNYYLRFYDLQQCIFITSQDWKPKYDKLPSGTYYIISGYNKKSSGEIYKHILSNSKIIELEKFQFLHPKRRFGYYIKFQK